MGLWRAPARQAGALPWRRRGGEIEVLLVTSSRRRRWIFPKGGREAGVPPPDMAAREAFEEAGVTGRIGRRRLGFARSVKIRRGRRRRLSAAYYPLAVQTELGGWPERARRRRRWARAATAAQALDDPALAALITRLLARLRRDGGDGP